MPHVEEQPTADTVKDLRRHLERVWEKTHRWWREVDGFLINTFDIWKDVEWNKNRPKWYSAAAKEAVEHASDNLLPYLPKVHRDEIGDATDAKPNAEAIELWTQAIFYDSSLEETFLPVKTAGKHMLTYGYAIQEAVWDKDEMPERPKPGAPNFENELKDYEAAQWNINPFRLKAPHPATVLLPPEHKRPRHAIRVSKWRFIDLYFFLYNRKLAKEENLVDVQDYAFPDRPYDEIEVTEYFSVDWHAIVAAPDREGKGNTDLLLVEKNLHRIVPFTHAFAGFGQAIGIDGGNDPVYLAVGLLSPAVLDIVRALSQLWSAEMELYMKAAFANLFTPNDPEEISAQLEEGNIAQADIRATGFLPVPQIPGHLQNLWDRLMKAFEEATFSRVSAGEKLPGISTVGQQAILQQNAFKRFLQASIQLSFMSSEMGQMFLKMLDMWGEQITVRGKKLRPSQLQNNYHIEITYPQVDEVLQLQKKEQGLREMQAGVKSRARYWREDALLERTAEEEEQLLEERVLALPEIDAMFQAVKKAELGLAEMLAKLEQQMAEAEATAQAASQNGGGGGRDVRQALTSDVQNPPRTDVGP